MATPPRSSASSSTTPWGSSEAVGFGIAGYYWRTHGWPRAPFVRVDAGVVAGREVAKGGNYVDHQLGSRLAERLVPA